MKTKKLVMSALFVALTFVATLVIQIKITANGFVNIGDCMVVVSGVFLGPVYGAVSASFGSLLADVVSGFALYAPATFVIKGLMAVAVGVVFKKLSKIKELLAVIICSVLAEIIMVSGYFLYEIFLYGVVTASLGMGGNLLQAGFGVVCSVVLYLALAKNKYIKNQLSFWV